MFGKRSLNFTDALEENEVFQFLMAVKWHLKRPSQYVFTLFTILTFFLIMIWKLEGVIWCSRLHPYSAQTLMEDALNNGDLENLYSVVQTVSPAFAWHFVVLNIVPHSSGIVKLGMSTFWGRATNELEIIALNIYHVGNDMYKAEFQPSFGGFYKVEIYLTYVNGEQFEYYTRHVKARMINETGSLFVWVQRRPPPANVTRYCSQSESGTARGRWVKCGALRGIERCGGWQRIPNFDFDGRHGYFWLPYSCQLHYYNDHEMKTCLAKNNWERIVLSGDSHSRYRTYHWVTRLYGACLNCGKNHVKTEFDLVPKIDWVFDARGTRWPATFPKSIRRPNEFYIHPKTRRSLFSYALPNSTLNGDLYVINFGHWILREMTFKTYMAKKVAAFLQALKLMSSTGKSSKFQEIASDIVKMVETRTEFKGKRKRFLWVNSVSLKWHEDEEVFKWRMTPSPSTINYLNFFLDEAMKDAGFQIVDAFQISNPRLTAIHDGTHYAKVFPNGVCAGVVENAVTNVILNALCNEQT